MTRAGGERVVIVVPTFAEAEDGDDRVVATMVVAVERAGAPDVADGVDAPRYVLKQRDPRDATPDQATEEAGPCRVIESESDGGDQQSQRDPEEVELIDE